MLGDSDDARALPFLDLVGWDFSDVRETGAVLFARPEWRGARDDVSLATALLAHRRSGARAPSARPPEPAKLEVFADGGYHGPPLVAPLKAQSVLLLRSGHRLVIQRVFTRGAADPVCAEQPL